MCLGSAVASAEALPLTDEPSHTACPSLPLPSGSCVTVVTPPALVAVAVVVAIILCPLSGYPDTPKYQLWSSLPALAYDETEI